MKNKYSLQIPFAALALFLTLPAWAQLQSKLVIVNGGKYESVPPFTDFVTIALYDPATRQYSVKDTINPDQSVQDLEIYGDTAFIVTDNGLSTFRLPDLTPISRNGGVKGIRNVVVVGEKIFGSRGFGSLPGENYVYVFDRNTLAQTGEVIGIPAECDDIILGGNKVYVSMPGEFGSDTGAIIRINPTTSQVDSILHLGPNGNGIGKLAVRGTRLTAFSTLGFGSTASSYTTYDWRAHTLVNRPISVGLGYTIPIVVADTLYGDFGGNISKFNYANGSSAPRAVRALAFAGLALDTLRDQFYVSSADFTSPAKLYTMTHNGALTDSLTIGIAPEKIAVFYQQATSVKPSVSSLLSLAPNPASTSLNVKFNGRGTYQILDLAGREHRTGRLEAPAQAIDLSSLAPGLYSFTLQSDKGYAVQRFVKR